jgi:4-cresol dehydrogenase (hydroxylating)
MPLYGTREQVDVNWKIVPDALKKLGKGRLITEEMAGDTHPSSTVPS